ncbi:MAG: hypothetical protein JW866_07345 [Ignavibacteriales bacterium]|nr:hypothetical protein [Ignavibacteriales bacterium]
MHDIDEKIRNISRERDKEVRRLLERLRTNVRKFPLNEFLYLLASFNWPGNNSFNLLNPTSEKKYQKGLLYYIYLPALAKYAILNSNDYVGESNKSIKKALPEVDEMVYLVNEIKDWIPSHLLKNPKFAIDAYLFQLKNQQFPFQEDPNNILSRSLFLFRDIPEHTNYDIDLSKAFHEIYGISLHRFWVLTLNLMMKYNGAWLSNQNFMGLDEAPLFIKYDEVTHYLNKISLNYYTFKERAKNPALSFQGNSNQFYGYSPFDSHPIIFRNNEFLIISPHHFIRRMYLPIYFDLLKYFQIGTDFRTNPFSSSFGKIFQAYVGKQLEYIKDGSEILPEFKFGTKKEQRDFTDWSLLYENNLILIEVKKNILPQDARFVVDPDVLKEKLNNSIIYGLKQCHNIIKHIENKTDGLERFKNIKMFFPVIVTFDDTYLLNSFFIRKIIDDELENNNIKFVNKWQVLTIREFEQVISLCNSSQTFLSLLKRKISSPEYLHMEWDSFLRNLGIEIKRNELLEKKIENEFEEANKKAQ